MSIHPVQRAAPPKDGKSPNYLAELAEKRADGPAAARPIGILLSGGLDSAALLGELLAAGRTVRPFYVRTGMIWQRAELAHAQQLLGALRQPRLLPLVQLDMPVGDLYGDHWGMTGRDTPDRFAPDEKMYLPGRNPLLLMKVLLWCGMHGVDAVALALLKSNPFADATRTFFDRFAALLQQATGAEISIELPYQDCTKAEILQRAGECALNLSFSCARPVGELHCGQCNKCAERQAAFGEAELVDATRYAFPKDSSLLTNC